MSFRINKARKVPSLITNIDPMKPFKIDISCFLK